MIKISQLTDKLQYPAKYRSQLVQYHSMIVDYIIHNFDGTYKFRNRIVHVINSITYAVLSNDYIDGNSIDGLLSVNLIDNSTCEEKLNSLFLKDREIMWDIGIVEPAVSTSNDTSPEVKVAEIPVLNNMKNTDKSDLYIKPPTFPQFNCNKIWMSGIADGINYTIYTSLPEVPTKQNQISVTTDLANFRDSDLLALYPTEFIHTRNAYMYDNVDGLTLHHSLGLLLPICGVPESTLIDNIIQYPHLFQIMREIDNKLVNFYQYIEIDGELYNVLDVWDNLPDTKNIPKNKEFIKEYVIRRYLIERDIFHKDHKFKMYGLLDPFITLFMPASGYSLYGYDDPIELAKSCVTARVNYKQSRNPIVRRLTLA